MLEFSFFEVFLCAQSELSEEKSAWERDNINNHERRAQTWFFWTCVLSKGGKTFSDLLSACKKQLDTSITTALVITWAFADTAGLKTQILDGVYLEGFVHASTQIQVQ